MDIKVLFGRRVKEFRKKHNYTQAQLAELVNVDDKHISCIEAGKNFPSPHLIGRLAEVMEIEPKDLFEFNHLQDPKDLKSEIENLLDRLSSDELMLVYKYIRTYFL